MNSFNDNNFVNTFEVPTFEDDVITVEYEALNTPMDEVTFVKKMAALTLGLGLIESQFSWCLGGSYYHMLNRWKRMALYGALGFLYNGFSDDGVSFNIVDFQLQLLMFTALMSLNEIRLVYGLSFGYGIGSEKFDGFRLTGPLRNPLPGNLSVRLFFVAIFTLAFMQRFRSKDQLISLLLSVLMIFVVFVYATGERMMFVLILAGAVILALGLAADMPADMPA